MAEDQPTATLVVLRGARHGRKYALGEAAFRIGREAPCELVLQDDFVAPLHTVLESRGGLWVAVNRGMNGTLVNGSRIEGPRTLAPGDQIQIGAETVLEFQVAAAEPKKKRKERKKKDATGAKKPLWENPVVIGGASVYLLLILVFFVWVGGRSSSDGKNDLDRQMVEAVSAKTREFLISDPTIVARDSGEVGIDAAAEFSSDFHALVAARRSGASDVSSRPPRTSCSRPGIWSGSNAGARQ
jgi:pSer/pThr/pTyr-binding forkhead associated (FHA) protein